MNNPTAFVSYSWDNPGHQQWAVDLTNKLRENGVDASIDVFETQKGTTNLYTMMVDNIRTKDYIIVLITNDYSKKANEVIGGVGFETEMLLPLIQTNKDKIIPIIRENSNVKETPFYLQGINYIDFSDDFKYTEKFKELLHRIYKVPMYEVFPIGSWPGLGPISSSRTNSFNSLENNDLIPSFKRVTDLDKNRFMKESYSKMKETFQSLMESTSKKNSNFEYECNNIDNRKVIYDLYLDGDLKHSIKMWLGSNFGGINDINLAYGKRISQNDNSMNEIIRCEVDSDNIMYLTRTLNIYSNNKGSNAPEGIAKEIWSESLIRLK